MPSSPRQTKQRHRLVETTHKITQLSRKESDRLPDVEFNFIPSSLPVSTYSVTDLESESITSKPTSSSGGSMVVTVQSSVKTPSDGASSPVLNVQQLILESLQQSSESENVTVYPSKGSVIQNGPKSITISGLHSDKESQKPPARVRRIEISSKSNLVDTLYVSNATIIPKSSPSTPLSPASMISKGGFTLKQHIAQQGDKPYQSHMTLHGRHSSTGSVILSPIMHHSEQLSPDETYSQTMEINTAQHHEKSTNVGSNSARKTQSLSTSPNDYNDDTPKYSVLHGRITRSESLPHEHGSCDSKVKSYAIWETEVGLPANWSSIHVGPSTTSQYTTG